MDIELLVVPDCADEAAALDLLTRTLSELGLADGQVAVRVVGGREPADELGFVGSPTFLIDGRDPFGEPGRDPGPACRVYRGPEGALSGLPDIRALREALKRAAAASRAPTSQRERFSGSGLLPGRSPAEISADRTREGWWGRPVSGTNDPVAPVGNERSPIILLAAR